MNEHLDTSVFRVYSRGIAAENATLASRVLEVWLQEDQVAMDGDVTSNVQNISATGKTAEGMEFSSNINVGTTVQAEWLSFNSNRPYPPLVRRGERLIIWRNADTSKYYWQEMGLDGHYRRGDFICMAAVSTVVEEGTPLSHENAYWFEVDSLNGIIKISTTDLNNEATTYALSLLTREGVFKFEDGLGNLLKLESLDKRWTIENGDQTKLVLDGINTLLEMQGDFRLKAKNVLCDIFENMKFNVAQNFSLQSMSSTMTAEVSYNISAPTIGFEGNLSSGGTGGGVGTASFNSQTTFNGRTIMEDGLTLNGIEQELHIHDGQHGPTNGPRNP